jgi:hypothetical protein
VTSPAGETGRHEEGRKGSRKQLSVVDLGPEQLDRWSRFVRESPHGSAYNLPAYLEALCSAGGGRYVVLAAFRGEEIVGGVATYERSSPLGSFVSPRLLLYYNGFVLREYRTKYPSERTARDVETTTALAEALEGRGHGRLELRSRSPFTDARPLLERGWRVSPSYTYTVPLADLGAQWDRVEQNLRRLVDRGREQGLTLSVNEDFESFFRLHAQTAVRKRAPLYLEAGAFRRYYDDLRAHDLCRLYHARLADGRVAASQLVLTGHPVTHTVSAAADADLQRTGANAFLRWSAFEDLAALGHVANDLTDASFGPVAHFKGQLGGVLETALVASRPMSARFRLQSGVYHGLRRARQARPGDDA